MSKKGEGPTFFFSEDGVGLVPKYIVTLTKSHKMSILILSKVHRYSCRVKKMEIRNNILFSKTTLHFIHVNSVD
jgi:hypothetical protein